VAAQRNDRSMAASKVPRFPDRLAIGRSDRSGVPSETSVTYPRTLRPPSGTLTMSPISISGSASGTS